MLTVLENGARAVYHFSGAVPFGPGAGIHLYGSDGVLHYDLNADRIRGTSRRRGPEAALEDVPIPEEKARSWRVEAEFVEAIRGGPPPRFTDFATGVAYMELTEAVARSARLGIAIELPLADLEDTGGPE